MGLVEHVASTKPHYNTHVLILLTIIYFFQCEALKLLGAGK